MALILNDAPAHRIADAELKEWSKLPTAVISDDLNRTQAMHAAIRPLELGMAFAGQALTCQVMVGDNAPLHYALGKAWPGCVVVVDARGHTGTAVWGGILTSAARQRGVCALVVDGSVRDAAELRESGISVYSRGVVPNGPHKGFGGSVNAPIQCAGVSVSPGDLVVGDDDGIVVVRPDQMDGLMELAKARIAKEEGMLAKIESGVSTVELLGLPPAEEL